MGLKSSSYMIRTTGQDAERKRTLERDHRQAMEKVVSDAKTLAEERKRALDEITDKELRESASR